MTVPAWSLFARASLGALVMVATSPLVAQVSPGAVASESEPTTASTALIQVSPFGAELNTTVDLCDDEGAMAWGLDAGRLGEERQRLGLDCGQGPIVGRIDLHGESTVPVTAIDMPPPPPAISQAGTAFSQPKIAFSQPKIAFSQPKTAFSQPKTAFSQPKTAFSQPPVEMIDQSATASGELGFFDTLLGYYNTAPVAWSGSQRLIGDRLGTSIGVVPSSLRVSDATVYGLVRNAGVRLATEVTVTLGPNQVTLPLALQPGEDAGFTIPKAASAPLGGALSEMVVVDAIFSDEPDFGRAIALSETFASTPERPELLIATASADNVELPNQLVDGFAIVDVVAVVTSLDERGRVLDVATVPVLGDWGVGDSAVSETGRIDSRVGAQLLRATVPGATSIVVNIGGEPVAVDRSPEDRADLEAGLASATYTSIAVTRGTFRGVMAGVDTLYAQGNGCRAVSTSRLASVLFAIPAHELAGWQPPAPASFGRSDNMSVDVRNERLYSFGRNNGRAPRAFWAPGIGIYQLDTLNLRVGAYAKANTKRATMLVGKLLLDRWCANGTNSMRVFLANTWHACANDACYRTSLALYDRTGDDLRNVTQKSGDSVTGGVKSRFCWSADRPGVYVRCRFFDISRLQGAMNMIAPDGGAGPNPYTPLPADFVELTIPTTKGLAEARVFMAGNTGYGREIWAIRPLGTNPRTTLRWYSQTWSSFDKDLSVWNCYSLASTNPRCSWSTTRAR